jgi:hypothetical protein
MEGVDSLKCILVFCSFDIGGCYSEFDNVAGVAGSARTIFSLFAQKFE